MRNTGRNRHHRTHRSITPSGSWRRNGGVSIATIWRHEKLGHIKGQRIGRRVLFPKEQIDRIKSLKATNRKADKNAKG